MSGESSSAMSGFGELFSLVSGSGGKLSPATLDLFALHFKKALAMSEGIPPYVHEAAENLRLSIKRYSQELKDAEKRKSA